MKRIKIELVKICRKKGLVTFEQIRSYVYYFKKYDDLTLRDLDEVVIAVNK